MQAPRRSIAFRSGFAAACLLAALVFDGCDRDPPKQKSPPPKPAAALKLLIVDDPQMAKAIHQLRGEWQARSPAGYEIVETSEADLLALDALPADVVIYPSYCLGALAEREWLAPVPGEVLASGELDWRDVFPTIQSAETAWGKTTYALPFGSPVLTCCCRADLFAQFKRKPPQTWAEYQELAEFFVRRENLGDADPAADAAWSGTIEPLGPGWASRTLLARAAAYAKHRDNYSTLFNVETMEPLIAGPPFVRALEDLVAAAKAGAPDQLSFTPDEVRGHFLAGHSAMALTWPTAAHVADAEKPGELLYDIQFQELPGSEKVFSAAEARWETRSRDEPRQVTLLAIAGRLGSVSQQSAQPAAAFRLLAWLSGPEWGTRVGAASPATTLDRTSQTRKASAWLEPGIDPKAAKQYASTVEQALSRPGWLFALRLPGQDEYLASLDKAVNEAVHDGHPPAKALEGAATAWREITKRLGPDAQRRAYARSLGLEQ